MPPSYKLLYKPHELVRYITNKNHIVIGNYLHQLSYRLGAPPCKIQQHLVGPRDIYQPHPHIALSSGAPEVGAAMLSVTSAMLRNFEGSMDGFSIRNICGKIMDWYIESHSKPWLLPSSIKVCFLCLFPAIQIEWDYSWLSHERAPGTTHRIA